MDRGLAEFRCPSFDSFLMHHVTCCNSESNGAETFACGGVNCRDRHYRHLKQGSPICEHEGCAQNDTPSHRLYTCKGTEVARSNAGWTAEHLDCATENGYACLQYGIWSLPQQWVRNLASSVLALVDFDFLQDAVGLARRFSGLSSPLGIPSRTLKLWFNNFPSRRKTVSVGVVTHSFVCHGHEHTKS
eukprot:3999598-Amphidinium_carterae.1